ncbi:MAG: hypothetical protein EOO29_52565, partial [Comamonadaceae bacterium]
MEARASPAGFQHGGIALCQGFVMRGLFQPLLLSGEHAVIKLVAVWPNEAQASSAAAWAAQSAGLGPAQVRVLGPMLARAPSHELLSVSRAPPSRPGILAPVWLAGIGAVLGGLFYTALPEDVASQGPELLSASVLVSFGAISGLMAGALFSLWPEHELTLRSIRRNLRRGCWVV